MPFGLPLNAEKTIPDPTMNSCHTPAVVACRVLGLYLATQSLTIFFNFVTMPLLLNGVVAIEYRWIWGGLALSVAVAVALAAGVWKFAPWIATKMLSGLHEEQATPSSVTLDELQAVALSVLGILLICNALPSLVFAPFERLRFLLAEPEASMKSLLDAAMIRTLVIGLTNIGLGVWLFLGARSFVRLFQRFRPARVR